MDYEKIGKFIQEKRKGANLTQKELGKKLNLTDKAISKWERGLGCPDISIIEKLSIILNVSIIEILNGEEKKNDNLTFDDLNKYVLDTVNYSKDKEKNKIKNMFLKIIASVILFTAMYLFVINLLHIISLNEYEVYNKNEIINNMKENVNKIEENLNILKSSTFYRKEELEMITTTLDESINYYKSASILKLEDKQKIYLKDLMKFDNEMKIKTTNYINIYNILISYNKNYEFYLESYKANWIARAILGNQTLLEPIVSYRYNFKDNNEFKTQNEALNSRIYYLNSLIVETYNLSSFILQVGGIVNENI